MYIDGQWTPAGSGAVFEVFNPANGEKIGEVPDGGSEDAAKAIAAARKAFASAERREELDRHRELRSAQQVADELVRLCRGWGETPPLGLQRPALMSIPLDAGLAALRGKQLENPWKKHGNIPL